MKKFLNVLDNKISENISSFLLSDQFNWRFINYVTNENDPPNLFYFAAPCYDNNLVLEPQTFNLVLPLLNFLKGETEKPLVVYRIKINAYPRTEIIQEHMQHRDYEKKGLKAFVYMVNENDGHTRINQQKVESIKNSGVLFESSDLHNSSSCTNAKLRLTINVNYW